MPKSNFQQWFEDLAYLKNYIEILRNITYLIKECEDISVTSFILTL